MILVDSPVWIDQLRGRDTQAVRKLQGLQPTRQRVMIGDLILMEVLMGARDEAQAERISNHLHEFPAVALVGGDVAEAAARNWRHLRGLGVTIRRDIDMLIGTFCILHGHALLHDDCDFRPMERHLGLLTL